MRILFLFFVFIIGHTIYAQDTLNIEYYKSTLQQLKSDPIYSEVVFHQTRYCNGNINCQWITIKFKDDLEQLNYSIGKSFGYYKNGKIRGSQNIDINTNLAIDTTAAYKRNGRLEKLIIWSKTPQTINAWRIGFKKVYERLPSDYKEIIFLRKGKKIEREYKNCKQNGYEILYNNDRIESKILYKEGIKITTPNMRYSQ
jgi:hypothetical protein